MMVDSNSVKGLLNPVVGFQVVWDTCAMFRVRALRLIAISVAIHLEKYLERCQTEVMVQYSAETNSFSKYIYLLHLKQLDQTPRPQNTCYNS